MIAPTLFELISYFDYSDLTIKETFEEVAIELSASKFKKLEVGVLTSAADLISDRDNLVISYIIGDGDANEFSSGGDAGSFIADVSRRSSIGEGEQTTINIRIQKQAAQGVLSVYDYSNFVSYLESLTIEAIFHDFNNLLKANKYLIFENQSEQKISKTSSIWFINKGFSGTPETIERTDVINKAKTSCHYNLLANFILMPGDFMLKVQDCPRLMTLFNRLTVTSAVAFLYDISVLDGQKLTYKLNGYKSINGVVELASLKADPESQYYKIYNWVYDSGNFNDKIGLARNIISLHLEIKDSLELKGDPFQSIQSSYKVYEKQNIKQYVEIRNKISDQLLSFHDRANKIIETFAAGFQKSALALITFYISAIVLKILNKDELIEVFTLDSSVLSTAFILCSAGYYFISKWEIDAQKDRFVNNYADIKKRYTDLLDEQDIERILNNDHEFKSDLTFMIDKGRNYTRLWFYFLVVLFSTTWLLYFVYNPTLLLKIANWFQTPCSKVC